MPTRWAAADHSADMGNVLRNAQRKQSIARGALGKAVAESLESRRMLSGDVPVIGSTNNITAVVGQNTGQVVLATFEDPNPGQGVASLSAQLAVGGWGDGTPTGTGIPLAVQQVGVDLADDDEIFEVLGAHTYTEATAPGVPDPLDILVATAGGSTAELNSPIGQGVTVEHAALTGTTGNQVTANAGISTAALLGTFADANPNASANDYLATVDWGDGSAPQLLPGTDLQEIGAASQSTWKINALHLYTEPGNYAYNVTLQETGGSAAVVSGMADVSDGTITPLTATTVSTHAGQTVEGSTLAQFADSDLAAVPGDFTATIDWGDGSSPGSAVVAQPGGAGTPFTVMGNHAYATSGQYDVRISISDAEGFKTTLSNLANVTDTPLYGAAKDIDAQQSVGTGDVVLATVVDPNPLATETNLTAYIASWGDGTPNFPEILPIKLIGGTSTDTIFQVIGGHIYAQPGVHDFTITASATNGPTWSSVGTATVAATAAETTNPAPTNLVATAVRAPVLTLAPGASTGAVELASFTDADPEAIGHYTATINWGNGASGAGVIAASNGGFTVEASTTYAATGDYSPTVTIQKDALAAQTVTDSDRIDVTSVTPHIATDSAIAFSGAARAKLSPALAEFAALNPADPAKDFKAKITWGDGKSTNAKIVETSTGHFDIIGSHAYAHAGDFSVGITLNDTFGESTTLDTTATVTAAVSARHQLKTAVARNAAIDQVEAALLGTPD